MTIWIRVWGSQSWRLVHFIALPLVGSGRRCIVKMRYSHQHPTTTRGFLETVNWNAKGAEFSYTIKDRTAGDPMRQDVVWTDVTPQEISDSLHAQAVCAGPRIVRRILDTLGLARRQRAKVLPGGDSPHRDAPFRHLAEFIQEFLEAGNPVLRIDTKKKEYVGTLY